MSEYKFEQNQQVQFDDGVNQGEGVIVGVSAIGLPLLGISYLVKVTDGSLPTEVYPFDTRVVFECHILS
jgi:hypothetical protein